MDDSATVLVTGSSGTIGTALCERLVDSPYEFRGVDRERNPWSERIDGHTIRCDLRTTDLAGELPTEADLVVHLAARSRVPESISDPKTAVENITMTSNVLEYACSVDAGVLLASSREVYGEPPTVLNDEAPLALGRCQNPYGASKVGSEALLFAYQNSYKLPAGALRLTNVYGPYDASDRVVPLFVSQALRGQNLTVYGRAKLLDFVFIADAVECLARSIESFETVAGEVINVGSGRGHSLQTLARRIVDVTESESGIEVAPQRTGEVDRFVADISKARHLLGYEPTYALDDGLEQTVDWLMGQDDVIDRIIE